MENENLKERLEHLQKIQNLNSKVERLQKEKHSLQKKRPIDRLLNFLVVASIWTLIFLAFKDYIQTAEKIQTQIEFIKDLEYLKGYNDGVAKYHMGASRKSLKE